MKQENTKRREHSVRPWRQGCSPAPTTNGRTSSGCAGRSPLTAYWRGYFQSEARRSEVSVDPQGRVCDGTADPRGTDDEGHRPDAVRRIATVERSGRTAKSSAGDASGFCIDRVQGLF